MAPVPPQFSCGHVTRRWSWRYRRMLRVQVGSQQAGRGRADQRAPSTGHAGMRRRRARGEAAIRAGRPPAGGVRFGAERAGTGSVCAADRGPGITRSLASAPSQVAGPTGKPRLGCRAEGRLPPASEIAAKHFIRYAFAGPPCDFTTPIITCRTIASRLIALPPLMQAGESASRRWW